MYYYNYYYYYYYYYYNNDQTAILPPRYCGVVNPSWSELTHFVCFLDKQLQDFENSVYCGMATSQDLPGFSVFVLRFLIQMSRVSPLRRLSLCTAAFVRRKFLFCYYFLGGRGGDFNYFTSWG